MPEEQFIKVGRELLYKEIWEISASGVAKKYNVKYGELIRICKEADIPVPSSGYWTKLSYGKTVEQVSLPESNLSEVVLPIDDGVRRKRRSAENKTNDETDINENSAKIDKSQENKSLPTNSFNSQTENTSTDNNQEFQIEYRPVSGKTNIYNREKLYEEVWSKPVIEVALQYGVSDVAIHKICKSLNIPAPPRGYWARIRSGEKIKRPPLPPTKGATEITGTKSFEGIKVPIENQQALAFLLEEERIKVLQAADQIQLTDGNARYHKKIAAYNSIVKEWNKKDWKPEGAKRSYANYTNQPPFLAGVISEDTLPRVYRILDSIFRQVEALGGSVNDDLSLKIRNEIVRLEIAEGQDEVDHVLTKQEAQALVKYEDDKKHNSYWASKPNIRKHDYVFNGKLRLCVRQHRYFRDTEKEKVESRLGEMLIELYEESEVVSKDRIAREEALRKEAEEKKRREERRVLYNEEIEKTIALTNVAEDYAVACKIRAYINALVPRLDMDDPKMIQWVDWVRKKADWFDPTIARKDEYLGVRDHEESAERKSLKKSYSW